MVIIFHYNDYVVFNKQYRFLVKKSYVSVTYTEQSSVARFVSALAIGELVSGELEPLCRVNLCAKHKYTTPHAKHDSFIVTGSCS